MIRNVSFLLVILFFLFFACQPVVTGAESGYLSAGEYNFNTKQWENSIIYQLKAELTSRHQLTGQVQLNSNHANIANLNFSNWVFRFQTPLHKWALYYNSPHLNKLDYFRILHPDYYEPNSLSFIYQYTPYGLTLLFSEKIPITQGLASRLGYFQWTKALSVAEWQVTAASYDSDYHWQQISSNNWEYVRNKGNIMVLAGESTIAQAPLTFAYALLNKQQQVGTDFETIRSQALVINSTFSRKQLRFRPGYRYIGSQFSWPLTKTNRYAKNRQGFFGDLRYQERPWQITYKFNALTNVDRTRSYPMSEIVIDYKPTDYSWFFSHKWQPTQQTVFGVEFQGFHVEWRFTGSQLRLGYEHNNHKIRWVSSSLGRQRIEYKYNNDLFTLQYIHKLHRPTGRNFNFLLLKIGEEQRFLEIRYGETDGGQLAAKFDHVPNLYLGWSWSW